MRVSCRNAIRHASDLNNGSDPSGLSRRVFNVPCCGAMLSVSLTCPSGSSGAVMCSIKRLHDLIYRLALFGGRCIVSWDAANAQVAKQDRVLQRVYLCDLRILCRRRDVDVERQWSTTGHSTWTDSVMLLYSKRSPENVEMTKRKIKHTCGDASKWE